MGRAYFVFGKASGFPAAIDLSSLDGSNGFTVDGTRKTGYLGDAIALAGDLNDDGFDDIALGENGKVYVIYGKGSFSAKFDLAALDGSNGFTVIGTEGAYVEFAGDINDDGIDDLAIGDPNTNSEGFSKNGRTQVLYGNASGFPATFDVADLDGTNGFTINGTYNSKYSGMALVAAEDSNGDGIDDLLIGSRWGSGVGDMYLVFGSASGFPATVHALTLDGSNGYIVQGVVGGQIGRKIGSGGDINGDGKTDLVAGSSLHDVNGDSSGQSYVVFGHSPATE